MDEISYVDYERLSDGSDCWLWQVRYRDRLWRAGVAKCLATAQGRARDQWSNLRMSLPAEERALLVPADELIHTLLLANVRSDDGRGPDVLADLPPE